MAVTTQTIDWGADRLGQGNCSCIFFHDEKWWGVFQRGPFAPLDWKLSRFDTSIPDPSQRWVELIKAFPTDTRDSENPDCIVDSANNRVYILGQGTASQAVITSMTYDTITETWSVDPLVSQISIPGIFGGGGGENDDECAMAVGQNGRIYVFHATQSTSPDLLVNWSDDNGATWESPEPTEFGATKIWTDLDSPPFEGAGRAIDAVQFIWDDDVLGPRNYVGVFWGEESGAGHRFLRILESADPGNKSNWVFENPGVMDFGEESAGKVAITRDASFVNNRLFAIVATKDETDFFNKHYCFVRDSKPGVSWKPFECEMTGLNPNPTQDLDLVGIQYDFSNNRILVFSSNSQGAFPETANNIYVRTATVLTDTAEDVTLTFGGVETHMPGGSSNMHAFGMRHTPVDSVSGLMIVARSNGLNATLHYGFLPISGAPIPPRPPPPVPKADPFLRLKIFPGFNDPIQIQHGDDQIRDGSPLAGKVHESPAVVIGNAIESYGGAKTIEIFRETVTLDTDEDPVLDTDGDAVGDGLVLVQAEQLIEDAKILTLPDINLTGSPFQDSTFFHYRLRLRSEFGSSEFIDVHQYAYVIVHQDSGDEGAS